MILFKNNRAASKFFGHPLVIPGLTVLLALYLMTIFAEFIAPYSFDNGNREISFQPPTKIHFVHNGKFSIIPFVYPYSFTFNDHFERIYIEDQSKPLLYFNICNR